MKNLEFLKLIISMFSVVFILSSSRIADRKEDIRS